MTKKDIKNSLTISLKKKDKNLEVLEDMVNDYLAFYDLKKNLQKDIKIRGVSFETMSSTGKKITKNNPSIKELLNVNRQMLAILNFLEIGKNEVGESIDL